MGIRINKGNAKDNGFVLENNVHITFRELQILSLVSMGLKNIEVANNLRISINTVRNHIYNVVQKLGAQDSTHALVVALENNILAIDLRKSLHWNVGGKGKYLYCLECSNAFSESDIEIEHVSDTINHQEVEYLEHHCPVCGGRVMYSWDEVLEKHPDYPKIPEAERKYYFEWWEGIKGIEESYEDEDE